MTKRAWWSIDFKVRMDGKPISMADLSEEARQNIYYMICQGCVAGEVTEEENK